MSTTVLRGVTREARLEYKEKSSPPTLKIATRLPSTCHEKALSPPVHLVLSVQLHGVVEGECRGRPAPAAPLQQRDQGLLGLAVDQGVVAGRHDGHRQAGLQHRDLLVTNTISKLAPVMR